MNAVYLDEDGKSIEMVMGCYGIGVGRTVAAAIEQSHDKDGIIFPAAIAPFTVIVVPVNTSDEVQMQIAEKIYQELMDKGVDAIIDDRDERAGIKFKDADMIGIPVRVTVGKFAVKENSVDIKIRKTGEVRKAAVDEAVSSVIECI
jgi:prolyl-tRNA synthetase